MIAFLQQIKAIMQMMLQSINIHAEGSEDGHQGLCLPTTKIRNTQQAATVSDAQFPHHPQHNAFIRCTTLIKHG